MRKLCTCLFYGLCVFTIVFSLFWMALPKLNLPVPDPGSEAPPSSCLLYTSQHIHFTGRRVVGDLPSLGDQVIGGIALSGHHHNYVIARVVGVCHNACHVRCV